MAAWYEHVAVNLRVCNPAILAQRAIPGMQERRFGRIVFVSSVAAFTGGIVGPHYAASKAGLLGLTHFLASRLALDGITVNAVAPALTEDTAMLPGETDELRSHVPVGRLGRPDEVAALVWAVVSNAYLTNQTISLDGASTHLTLACSTVPAARRSVDREQVGRRETYDAFGKIVKGRAGTDGVVEGVGVHA